MVDSVYYKQHINGNYKMKQNVQNQTISELYTDDKISKYSSNPNDILKSAKYFYEKLYAEETMSKISNKQYHHCEVNNFLEKVTKSTNSQTNIKSPGNGSITAKYCKHFSYPWMCINNIPSNVYDYQSWEKLDTMGVTSITEVISLIYEKNDKEVITNYRSISLLNLD